MFSKHLYPPRCANQIISNKMTMALAPTAVLPSAKLRPIAKQAPISQWQAELEHLLKELAFYQKLLKMGINSCPENKKPSFYRLLEEFSDYSDTVVSTMKKELATFGESGDAEPALIIAFHKRMEVHRIKFFTMKESVFPLTQHLQKITIW